MHDGTELIVCHRRDGIPHTKTGNQQGHTAAHTKHHHNHTLFISENIPGSDFVQETQPLPHRGNVFQKNPLARFGCLGPHQLRRHLTHIRPCRSTGSAHRAKQCKNHGNGQQPPVQQQLDGSEMVQNLIGVPDHQREQPCAQQISHQTAQQGRRPGIGTVTPEDLAITVAQCFQGAILRPLLLHHTGHGGRTDQRCHQEEKHRENACNAVYNFRIVFKAGITGVGIAIQRIVTGIFQCIHTHLGIFQFFLCLCQFLLGFCKFRFCLGFAFLVFLQAIGILLFAVLQLLPTVIQLCSAFRQRRFNTVLQFPFAQFQLLAAILYLCCRFLQLTLAVFQLFYTGKIFAHTVFVLGFAVLQLLISLCQLPFTVGKLFLQRPNGAVICSLCSFIRRFLG